MKKSLLIAAYYFPPIGGAGAQRPLKFARYLCQAGWDVTVVTRGDPDDQEETPFSRWMPNDSDLEDQARDLDGQLTVVRVPDSYNQGGFRIIDVHQNWSEQVGGKIIELAKANRFDGAFFTMSPFSLVKAATLVKRNSNIPVILDFRDPWVFDGWQVYRSWIHWRYQYGEMKRALIEADGAVINTPESTKIIAAMDPEHIGNKLITIENGFDLSDFSDVAVSATSENIDIVFTGSFCTEFVYEDKNLKKIVKDIVNFSAEEIEYSGRTLIYLLRAIKELASDGFEDAKRYRIHCYGSHTDSDLRSVEESGMTEIVKFHGYVSHDKSIEAICNADVLFLPLHGVKRGERTRIIPGKTFEYLATGRPILGCLPEGDARDLVNKADNSCTADPCDIPSIKDALRRLSKVEPEADFTKQRREFLAPYERKALTEKLARFIESLI